MREVIDRYLTSEETEAQDGKGPLGMCTRVRGSALAGGYQRISQPVGRRACAPEGGPSWPQQLCTLGPKPPSWPWRLSPPQPQFQTCPSGGARPGPGLQEAPARLPILALGPGTFLGSSGSLHKASTQGAPEGWLPILAGTFLSKLLQAG